MDVSLVKKTELNLLSVNVTPKTVSMIAVRRNVHLALSNVKSVKLLTNVSYVQQTEFTHQLVHAHQDLPLLKENQVVYHVDLNAKNVKVKNTVPFVKKTELNHQSVDAKMVLLIMVMNAYHAHTNAKLVMKMVVSNALMEESVHQHVNVLLEHLMTV
jgi:hypothetical protein